MPFKPPAMAALLHLYQWNCPFNEVAIAPGLSVCRFKGTPIEVCYQRLCEVQSIDRGEPFDYRVFLLIKEPLDDWNYHDPMSILNRMCNVMTIVLGSPVKMCRALISRNNFASLPQTELVFVYSGQTEFLEGWPSITPANASELVTAWSTVQEMWEVNKTQGRVANALLFFNSAWRSHHIEHICLNMAICLEILFAPHANVETTHQIAFNFSRFLASEPKERERLFVLCKKFYGMRSAIVHGGIPDGDKVIDATVEMFPVLVKVLKTLVLNAPLARTFDNEQERKNLLRQNLFT